ATDQESPLVGVPGGAVAAPLRHGFAASTRAPYLLLMRRDSGPTAPRPRAPPCCTRFHCILPAPLTVWSSGRHRAPPPLDVLAGQRPDELAVGGRHQKAVQLPPAHPFHDRRERCVRPDGGRPDLHHRFDDGPRVSPERRL